MDRTRGKRVSAPADTNYAAWLRNLKTGITKNIISVIEPAVDALGQERAAKMVDDRRMQIWAPAFTDSAVSGSSYEPSETYGDTLAKVFVVKEIRRKFPGIQPEEITALSSYYVSNKVQGQLMMDFMIERKVRGKPIIRQNFIDAYMLKPSEKTGLQMTPAIYADMYESILGAIADAGDDIENGLGLLYASRWFNYIFVQRITIEERFKYGEVYNIAKNLFSRFDFYHVEVVVNGEKKSKPPGLLLFSKRDKKDVKTTTSSVEFTVTMSVGLINFLRKLDDDLFSQEKKNRLPKADSVLAVGGAETKEEAREEAAERALRVLEEVYGINEAWVAHVKSVLDNRAILADAAYREAYIKVVRHVKSKGYENMRFKILYKHSKEGNYQGMQIIADDPATGAIVLLFSKLYEKGNRYIARKDAIRDYAADEGL